jgi:hypothetical protein
VQLLEEKAKRLEKLNKVKGKNNKIDYGDDPKIDDYYVSAVHAKIALLHDSIGKGG